MKYLLKILFICLLTNIKLYPNEQSNTTQQNLYQIYSTQGKDTPAEFIVNIKNDVKWTKPSDKSHRDLLQADSAKFPYIGEFGKQVKCSDTTRRSGFANETNLVGYILFATDIEGPDKDLFSYDFVKPFPITWSPYETIYFYVNFNSTNATPGIKTAYFYIHLDNGDKETVFFVELTAEVISITAIPNQLDFGDIETIQIYYENIKLENPTTEQATIKTGYLVKNTDFNLETNLDGETINGSLLATVSLNPNISGVLTDTLIIITEYKNCIDTLWIPIRANVSIPIGNVKFTIRASENEKISPTKTNHRIPIYITSNTNITDKSLTIKQLILTINKNIFHPKLSTNGDVFYHYNDDTINIKIENISIPIMAVGEETLLLELVGNILLGNTDSSVINLLDTGIIISWTELEPELINGCITINICTDRLLMLYDKQPGVFIVDDPASGIFKIKCLCYENGYYYIEIINILGQSFVPLHPNNGWFVNPKLETEFYFDVEIPHYLNNDFYYIIMYGPTKNYYDSFILFK